MRVEYRCTDGGVLPVLFERADDAEGQWALDREHTPYRLTPLAEALTRIGDVGACRAYEEVGMVRPEPFRPGPDACGFAYYSRAPIPEAELSTIFTAAVALIERYGSALGIWEEYCLPLVRADCSALAEAAVDAPLARLAEVQAHCLHVTMIPAFVGGRDVQQLAAVLEPVYGAAASRVANELTQGRESTTLQADAELWRLGRMVAASTELGEALGAPDPATAMGAVRDGGREVAFFDALDAFLDVFGQRAEGWEIGFPTWAEQRAGFWSQLRHLSADGVADPAGAVGRAAARRADLVAEAETALTGDDEALARFRRRLERVERYVHVREDRAHWQLVSCGLLRGAVLRKGEALVAAGAVDDPEDVLFLLPAEVEGRAPGHDGRDLRALVVERRAEHDRWLRVSPPEVIGGGAEAPPDAADDDTADGTEVEGGPVLVRGVGASRGTVTAPARVIKDLADADRLEPGDVLVCVMTAPPWTPLFQIASAVVADSGDMGSHVAIAAREYGIPCVLGTATGTQVLRDGQVVAVDGAAGVVRAVAD